MIALSRPTVVQDRQCSLLISIEPITNHGIDVMIAERVADDSEVVGAAED